MSDPFCYLSPRQARLIVALLSFGGFFLWILFGNYSYLPPAHRHQRRQDVQGSVPFVDEWRHGRRLLSVNDSAFNCSNVHLVMEDGSDVEFEHNGCSDLRRLNNESTACDFVRCVESCSNEDGLINYLQFLYCQVPGRLIPAAMVFLFIWLVFLFIVLGATAEEYFCPALTVMSQVLRLSQNVAGVTLLALGNGSPDIFSAFAAINQDEDKKSSLAVGALFGAGIFVTTIVVGAVTITKPFTLTQRPFLRDIIFYMFAAFWTFYLLWTGYVNIYHAVGFVAFYAFYVAVVIVGRLVFQKWKKIRHNRKLGTGDIPRPPAKPMGEEMSEGDKASSKKKRKKEASSSVADEGLRGLFTRMPLPGVNGHVGGSFIQDADQGERERLIKDEREEKDTEEKPQHESGKEREEESREARLFRIQSVGSSEMSASVTVPRPVIKVTVEDEDEREKRGESERRERELAGGTLPTAVQRPAALAIPIERKRRGGSAGPHPNYGSIQGGSVSINRSSPSHSPSTSPNPGRRRMRKTISGALDLMDEIGAAVAIPHSPQVWEEVHRVHHSYRARSRSRSRSRSAIHEVPDEEKGEHREPSDVEEGEGEGEEEEEEEDDESDDEETPLIKFQKKPNQFVKALLAFWPFGEAFKELSIFNKIIEIIKIPATIFLTLTVPIVDHNEDDHNWNKWLNVVHCITGPVFIATVTKLRDLAIAGVFPIWGIVLILGFIVAVLVAVTSKADKPPIYHCAFAWLGFAVSIVWIYSIANEIVNLLQVFGIVMRLSDGILGLTLLAWGNSIGDAVSNLTMAKQGFPRMAIGACFGGPLLNMLLGIGIASVVKTIRRKADNFQFKLFFTKVELLASVFLLFNLALSLVVIVMLKFRLKRFYGGFLIAYYVVFLALAVMAEFNVFPIDIPGVIDID